MRLTAFAKKKLQAKKQVRDVDGVPSAATQEAIFVTYVSNVMRVDLASIRHEYAEYRLQKGGRGEDERVGASDSVDPDALFENNFL